MLCDLHTHTHNSFDGFPEATAHAMAQAAIDAGVGVLALTDHCEVNGQVQGLYPYFDQAAAFAEVSAARDAFAGKVAVDVIRYGSIVEPVHGVISMARPLGKYIFVTNDLDDFVTKMLRTKAEEADKLGAAAPEFNIEEMFEKEATRIFAANGVEIAKLGTEKREKVQKSLQSRREGGYKAPP